MFESGSVAVGWPPVGDPGPDAPAPVGLVLDWAEAEPSLAAAGLVAGLDPREMSAAERCRYLALLGRIEAQVAGARLAAVAAVAGPEPGSEAARAVDFASCEVAVALRLADSSAQRMVHATRRLHADLPATAAALAAGRVGYLAALAIVEGSYGLAGGPVLGRFEELVVDRAAGKAPGQVRALVRRTVARLDAGGLAEREAAARQRTDVFLCPGQDGTAELVGRSLPAVDAALVQAGVDAYARSAKARGDTRTVGQLRAAALTAWAQAYLTGPAAPRSQGRPVTVQVSVDLPTFLGLTDHPGEVAGVGPIPAQVARELVADARLRRLITDPMTGALLDYGRRAYRPGPGLAAAVAARYVTTTGPGSTASARAGDRDHDTPYGQGGATSPDNLHPVTRRWHNAKTHGGWRTSLDPASGTLTWTSPTGQTARTEPHDYRLGP